MLVGDRRNEVDDGAFQNSTQEDLGKADSNVITLGYLFLSKKTCYSRRTLALCICCSAMKVYFPVGVVAV